uniref:Uncharacterized protein n=1 Tax=Arundo donax TaxID=35708 RepID=A0A0A9DAQ1_ARUDO
MNFLKDSSVGLFAEDFSENALYGESDKVTTKPWKCSSDSKSKCPWPSTWTSSTRQ